MTRVAASIRRDLETTGAAGLALLVLFLGVVTNRYRFDALPLRPHPEHLALLVAGGILVLLLLARRVHLRLEPSDFLLGAYLLLALASSWLFADVPGESVRFWARMFGSVAVYFLARWLIEARNQSAAFRLGVKALLIFGVLEALFGIGSWFLYPLGVNLGVDEYPLGVRGPGGILCNFSLTMYGTLWEPNAFGSAMTTVILVAAALFVSDSFRAWRKPLGIAIAVMLVALGLNAGRAALGVLLLGLAAILLVGGGMTFIGRLKWALAALVLLVVVSAPSLEISRALMQLPSAPGLATRAPCAEWLAQNMPRGTFLGDPLFDPPTGPDSGSVAIDRLLEGQTLTSRWVSYQLAWNDFVARPIFGNGADSFGQRYTTTAHTPGWISNMFLMSLHDTGIVGTLVLLAWLGWYARRIWKGWRASGAGQTAAMVLAVAIGLTGLLIAYQATTMLWFGLVWWFFALLEGGARQRDKVNEPVRAAPAPGLNSM